MSDDPTPPYRRVRYRSVNPPPGSTDPGDEDVSADASETGPEFEPESRVAITLSVGDGFKFGCGLLLAASAFYFALIMVIAVAILIATILGIPLPFGGGR